jgi:hypothetical protein
MYLAEFNFIGLFESLGWWLGFLTNIFQVEISKIISCFDVAAVKNPIYTYYISK